MREGPMVLYGRCALFHPHDIVVLAGTGRGQLRVGGIADDAVAYAFVVALDAEVAEDGAAFLAVELFLGAVYPAGAEAEGMGGEHEVAHDEAAVVEIRAAGTVGQDEDDGGGAVERVEAGVLLAQLGVLLHKDFSVHAGETLDEVGARDGHDAGGLQAVAGGGIGAGLADLGEDIFGNRLVEVLAYAAAGLDEVEHKNKRPSPNPSLNGGERNGGGE